MVFFMAVILFSYLLGAIPFGLLIAKWRSGVDIRETGSGNIGATNVLRTTGKKEALLTLTADILKGLIPVLLVQTFTGNHILTVFAGTSTVAGHIFPVFLKFKGGKGVATALGVLIYLMPEAALTAILIFALVTYLSKYVSLGSMIAAATIPFLGIFYHSDNDTIYAATLIALLVIARHHKNIRNLLAGCENKLGSK